MTSTLYHGSRRGISGAIRPDRSDGACDFGCGFYMGTVEDEVVARLMTSEAVAKPPLWCGETPHLRGRGVLTSPDDYDRMRRVYPGYHAVSCELAVSWLKGGEK